MLCVLDTCCSDAVSSHADLHGKRGTFIYDMTACRELVLLRQMEVSRQHTCQMQNHLFLQTK